MINPIIYIALLLLAGCSGRRLLPVQSGTVKAGGYQVYYEQKGKGSPVVLLHAGMQNHHMWKAQVAALSKHFTVVTLDLPYHGNTTGYDTSTLASAVVKTVLDSLHLDPVAIAGLSMGAAIAQDFVIAYPDRVTKAVFMASGINGYEKEHAIDSVTLSWYPQFSAALNAKDTAGAARVFALTWAEGINHQHTFTKTVTQAVYDTTLATLRQHRLRDWPHLQNHPPAMENLSSIRVPVLIIHGDKDLPFIATASKYLEKAIPGAERAELKGAAHMINLEREKEVTERMLNFLQHKKP